MCSLQLVIPNHGQASSRNAISKVPCSTVNMPNYFRVFSQHLFLLACFYLAVVHVVSSSKFAVKAEEAGCDAVVAEGFEAGGHNGREETTSMVL